MERIDLYLHQNVGGYYVNTERENELVTKFQTLYSLAKSARDSNDNVKPGNLDMWRRAYLGTLNALKKDGTEESERKSRQVRKLAYEVVESTVDNSIPLPKIVPRYKADRYLINITEEYLKFEMNKSINKMVNDANERATYIDGTSWFKVTWNSLDTTHNRSGDVRIEHRNADQVIPQPGVVDYHKLEYIFEISKVSMTEIYDLYDRLIIPTSEETNMVDVISCYYLNENRIVGLFMWAAHSNQVICNEKDWQIRKIRHCTKCDTIVPEGNICPVCGHNRFRWKNAEKEILQEAVKSVFNPYEVPEQERPSDYSIETVKNTKGEDTEIGVSTFAPAGTEIPFYVLRELPFVPRPAVSNLNDIYGVSQVRMLLEMQDCANKVLTKAIDKTMKSGGVVTKPSKLKINDTDQSFKILSVNSAEEGQMVQVKQIVADTSQDLNIAAMLYDSAKSSSGITDSFQGKKDTTATSGKAKQYAVAQSAGRIESLRVMKAAAYAGLYNLVLKYLLAFSDAKRTFVRVLPNGKEQEEQWSKYMFLDKGPNQEIYYRDDFEFNTDPAATLSEDRVSMWNETQEKFIQGSFGDPTDPRVLELYWNTLSQLGYPLSKTVLAGIKENAQHLPPAIENAIMQSPELQQMIQGYIAGSGEQRGGARPNSGPVGNGATHSANVERTNARNAAAQSQSEAIPRAAQNATLGGAV